MNMEWLRTLADPWRQLTPDQQIHRLLLIIAVLAVIVIILAIVAGDRRATIVGYHERVNALEARIAVLDQKVLAQQQRTDRLVESVGDARHLLESEVLRNNEQDRVLESGRMLPRTKRPAPLERPPAARPQ